MFSNASAKDSSALYEGPNSQGLGMQPSLIDGVGNMPSSPRAFTADSQVVSSTSQAAQNKPTATKRSTRVRRATGPQPSSSQSSDENHNMTARKKSMKRASTKKKTDNNTKPKGKKRKLVSDNVSKLSPEEIERRNKAERMRRNRAAAQNSRDRKKMEHEQLVLENKELKKRVISLVEENRSLKKRIAELESIADQERMNADESPIDHSNSHLAVTIPETPISLLNTHDSDDYVMTSSSSASPEHFPPPASPTNNASPGGPFFGQNPLDNPFAQPDMLDHDLADVFLNGDSPTTRNSSASTSPLNSPTSYFGFPRQGLVTFAFFFSFLFLFNLFSGEDHASLTATNQVQQEQWHLHRPGAKRPTINRVLLDASDYDDEEEYGEYEDLDTRTPDETALMPYVERIKEQDLRMQEDANTIQLYEKILRSANFTANGVDVEGGASYFFCPSLMHIGTTAPKERVKTNAVSTRLEKAGLVSSVNGSTARKSLTGREEHKMYMLFSSANMEGKLNFTSAEEPGIMQVECQLDTAMRSSFFV